MVKDRIYFNVEDIEDIDYIKTLLNQCIKINIDNRIYYITNENIVRQLKYNKILKQKHKIKYNLIYLKLNLKILF